MMTDKGIRVTGHGEIRKTPDFAVISYRIVADSPAPAGAERQVRQVYDDFMSIASEAVKDCEINADRISVMPVYAFDGKKQSLTGYEGVCNITLKLKDFKRISLINTLAFDSGINRLLGIEYSVEDTNRFEEEAAKLAVADAKKQAELMAESFSLKLGSAESIHFMRQGRGVMPRLLCAEANVAGQVRPETALYDPEPVVISASVEAVFSLQ